MSYVLQRISLRPNRLPPHVYVCGLQDVCSKRYVKKQHLHSLSRRKACPLWLHRLRPVYRLSPVCSSLKLPHSPHINQSIYTVWNLSSKHSFHSTTYFCAENNGNETKSKETVATNANKTENENSKASGEAKPVNNKAVDKVKGKDVVVKLTIGQKIARFHENASKVGYARYIWNGLKGFIIHLKDGFKLFLIDLRISAPLLWKYFRKGRSAMKRREYRQLTRTLADLIRMIPLIASVVIPFGEIAMPFLVAKGLMPKAFISKEQQNERDRQKLQKKVEYGALLSESLKHMSGASEQGGTSLHVKDFLVFIEKVKSGEIPPTNEEIMKFTRLFADELTLEDLRVDQLQGLCKLLGIDLIGQIPSERILRFQIDVKLRELMVDDKVIQKEGLDSLAVWELQQACRARGMRAIGVSEERLRLQLEHWLELHLKEKIPSSLLLLSRVMYLDENLTLSEALHQTISTLPESTMDKVIVQSAETLGEDVDKQTRIKVLHKERKIIKEQELKEKEEKKKKDEEEAAAKKEEEAAKKEEETAKQEEVKAPIEEDVKEPEKETVKEEVLVDKAEPLVDTAEQLVDIIVDASQLDESLDEEAMEHDTDIESQDLADIEKAIEDMSRHEKDEIEDVKEDLAEGMRSLLLTEEKVDKGAKKLQAKLTNYLDDLSSTMDDLSKARAKLQEKLEIEQVQLQFREDEQTEREELKEAISEKKRNLVSINEVLLSLRRLQKLPDDVRMQKVLEVLDDDHDGMIDINDVLKVTEELIRENLKLNKSQVATMMSLLRKEDELEEERRIQEREEMDGQNGPDDMADDAEKTDMQDGEEKIAMHASTEKKDDNKL